MQTDLTRMSRKERRNFRKQTHLTVPGRNLPYQKSIHGSISAYNELRDKEVSRETKEVQKTNG